MNPRSLAALLSLITSAVSKCPQNQRQNSEGWSRSTVLVCPAGKKGRLCWHLGPPVPEPLALLDYVLPSVFFELSLHALTWGESTHSLVASYHSVFSLLLILWPPSQGYSKTSVHLVLVPVLLSFLPS